MSCNSESKVEMRDIKRLLQDGWTCARGVTSFCIVVNKEVGRVDGFERRGGGGTCLIQGLKLTRPTRFTLF